MPALVVCSTAIKRKKKERNYTVFQKTCDYSMISWTTVWANNFYPPPWGFLIFSQRAKNFFFLNLHACYSFIPTLNCKILFNFPQLWQSYAVLNATTQWIFTFNVGLVEYCTDFIAKDEWPPNSPDLNPLDYHVWGAMLQAFHKLHPKPKTIPELKSALQQTWDDLPQTTTNEAVNDFRKRLNKCISAGGGHFEHTMWTLCRNILTELFAVS